jgi:uncharacterized DUF497 family protein
MGKNVISDNRRFEWDEEKALTNFKKHGLTFDEILPLFDDLNMLELYDDEHSINEEYRNIGIGMLQGVLVLYVCYIDRNNRTRIFSARKARPREEAKYYEQFKTTNI